MLDRNTFKKRLISLLNYFTFADKLYDLTNGYFSLFAIEPLEEIISQYESMLIELIGERHRENIEYWIDSKIVEMTTGTPKITIKADGKDYDVSDIDIFYNFLCMVESKDDN